MTVSQLAPRAMEVEADELVRAVAAAPRRRPFAVEAIDLCADLSARLFADGEARRYPELQALAFWLRRAEVMRLANQFAALPVEDALLVPAGTVFHVAPGNVDTMFVYSWALSMLLGNGNVVRVSTRPSEQVGVLVRLLAGALARESAVGIARGTSILTYPHDEAVTASLSAGCDLRVIWGGDESVRSVRAAPLPPHATELVFPDRFSFSVIRAAPFLALSETVRTTVVERFFNDTYWFDQLGCASPRLLVWVGAPPETREAAAWFLPALGRQVRLRGYEVAPATAIGKLLFSCRAVLDAPVGRVERDGNEVTLLPLEALRLPRGEHCGGGALFQYEAGSLGVLRDFVARKDQTMTYFGFEPRELWSLAAELNGQGVDRMVPVGQALSFSRFWDGHDLFQAFTRRVRVEGPGGSLSPAIRGEERS